MTQSQSLYIHLLREEDGAVSILAWEVVLAREEGEDLEGEHLPVSTKSSVRPSNARPPTCC